MNGFTDPFSILRHLALPVFLEFEDKPDVIVPVAGGDMKVKMENGLSGNKTVVGKDVETVELKAFNRCLSDPVGGFQKAFERCGLDLEKIPAMIFRDHQGMTEMDRIDIEDAKCLLVLVKNLSRDFAGNNLAENTIVHLGERAGAGSVNVKSIKK